MSVMQIFVVVCSFEGVNQFTRAYKRFEDAQKFVDESIRLDEIDGHTELFSYEIHNSPLFEKH